MDIKIKKLNERAVTPSYAKYGDAGLDLTAISKRDTEKFIEYGTGLSVEIPEGYMGLIFPRSSVSNKDLIQANSVGVIDSGYRGEILVRFKDLNKDFFGSLYVEGDRVAQLIILPHPKINIVEVDELSSTDRGSGGFGHTDVI